MAKKTKIDSGLIYLDLSTDEVLRQFEQVIWTYSLSRAATKTIMLTSAMMSSDDVIDMSHDIYQKVSHTCKKLFV